METSDIVIAFWQASIEQFTSTNNLHASSAGTDESQERMGNLSGTLANGIGLFTTSEVVHLQEHQTVVGFHDTLFVSVLHLRRETNPENVLRVEMEEAVHGVVLLAYLY